MRIEIGSYKFILGLIVVIALSVVVPQLLSHADLPEWARGIIPPLAAIAVGLSIGSFFSRRLTGSVGGLLRATRSIAEGDLRQGRGDAAPRFGRGLPAAPGGRVLS